MHTISSESLTHCINEESSRKLQLTINSVKCELYDLFLTEMRGFVESHAAVSQKSFHWVKIVM